MKDFFKDVFEYHHHFNQKLADFLVEHMTRLDQRTMAVFSHLINAHQIWNARILETSSLTVHQMHTLEVCKSLDHSNYMDSIRIIADFDMHATITYENSKGRRFENSIEQILFHVANHHTHHKGQIVAQLRQKGIEPIVTDYIFYKR